MKESKVAQDGVTQLQFVQCSSQTNTPPKQHGLVQVRVVQSQPCCQPLPNCTREQCWAAQNEPCSWEHCSKALHEVHTDLAMLGCSKALLCWMHLPFIGDPTKPSSSRARMNKKGFLLFSSRAAPRVTHMEDKWALMGHHIHAENLMGVTCRHRHEFPFIFYPVSKMAGSRSSWNGRTCETQKFLCCPGLDMLKTLM